MYIYILDIYNTYLHIYHVHTKLLETGDLACGTLWNCDLGLLKPHMVLGHAGTTCHAWDPSNDHPQKKSES